MCPAWYVAFALMHARMQNWLYEMYCIHSATLMSCPVTFVVTFPPGANVSAHVSMELGALTNGVAGAERAMRVELTALVARGNVQLREVAVAGDLHVEVCTGRASASSSTQM
jgi:hypothetical protein